MNVWIIISKFLIWNKTLEIIFNTGDCSSFFKLFLKRQLVHKVFIKCFVKNMFKFSIILDKRRAKDNLTYLNSQPLPRPIIFHALFTSLCLVTRLATLSRLPKEALSLRLFACLVVSLWKFILVPPHENLGDSSTTSRCVPVTWCAIPWNPIILSKFTVYNRSSLRFKIALPMVQCVASKSRKTLRTKDCVSWTLNHFRIQFR